MVDEGIPQANGRNRSPRVGTDLGAGKAAIPGASTLQAIQDHLSRGGRLWLFLDYDGTLVPIVRTPDEAQPDAQLLDLLGHLATRSRVRTVVLSGRPLSALEELLPVPGFIRAGLYGVEIDIPGEGIVTRARRESIRRVVVQVRDGWALLVRGRSGFLVEDKGLAVALHSRFANPAEAALVIPQAQALVSSLATEEFRVLGGDRFLEIAPAAAHKGETVEWLFNHISLPDAQSVYFGDDDKDEEAFAVIRKHRGIPIVVGSRQPHTQALIRLPSHTDVRLWLESIISTN